MKIVVIFLLMPFLMITNGTLIYFFVQGCVHNVVCKRQYARYLTHTAEHKVVKSVTFLAFNC
jgi:hypothetical protein